MLTDKTALGVKARPGPGGSAGRVTIRHILFRECSRGTNIHPVLACRGDIFAAGHVLHGETALRINIIPHLYAPTGPFDIKRGVGGAHTPHLNARPALHYRVDHIGIWQGLGGDPPHAVYYLPDLNTPTNPIQQGLPGELPLGLGERSALDPRKGPILIHHVLGGELPIGADAPPATDLRNSMVVLVLETLYWSRKIEQVISYKNTKLYRTLF